ncbi:MAG: hypothetical protein Q7J35_11235 [Candidatus Methanoperedens sp.]|nr:hypothetical protein [Candidatus Methanoperedens sp.]
MSLTRFQNFIKKLDRPEDHYKSLTEIMRDLQPIAFLISASLILSVFLGNKPISQGYAVFASVLFFMAYVGIVVFNIFKYKWFFYWGLSLIVLGITFLYYSFGDVISIILKSNIDKNFSFAVSLVVISMVIILNKFSLDYSNNKNIFYKILRISFWVELVLILIFLTVSIYLNIYIFTIGLFLIGILLMMNIILIPLSQMLNSNNK